MLKICVNLGDKFTVNLELLSFLQEEGGGSFDHRKKENTEVLVEEKCLFCLLPVSITGLHEDKKVMRDVAVSEVKGPSKFAAADPFLDLPFVGIVEA